MQSRLARALPISGISFAYKDVSGAGHLPRCPDKARGCESARNPSLFVSRATTSLVYVYVYLFWSANLVVRRRPEFAFDFVNLYRLLRYDFDVCFLYNHRVTYYNPLIVLNYLIDTNMYHNLRRDKFAVGLNRTYLRGSILLNCRRQNNYECINLPR